MESKKQKRRKSLLNSTGFYKKLDSFSELIDRLSQQNFESLRFINQKKKIVCPSIGMNATLYSLKGIIALCEIGDIVDAFTLVRKIRDNLYLDLFFISESLNNRPNNYEFLKPFTDMTQEEITEEIIQYASAVLDEEKKNENIQNISHWFENDYSSKDNRSARVNMFSFSAFKRNIEAKYPLIKECHQKYLTKVFDDLNNGLNNYVHSNGPSFLSNDVLNMDDERFINSIKDLLHLLDLVKRLFLIDLYLIDSTMFKTDDYVDALDMGVEPIEGSQYDAIYQIVEEFEDIDKECHDLYNFLKNNNRLLMKCFYDSE